MVDLATYGRGGTRCFAVLFESRMDQGSIFFAALSQHQMRSALRSRGALHTRARAYHSPAGWRRPLTIGGQASEPRYLSMGYYT